MSNCDSEAGFLLIKNLFNSVEDDKFFIIKKIVYPMYIRIPSLQISAPENAIL